MLSCYGWALAQLQTLKIVPDAGRAGWALAQLQTLKIVLCYGWALAQLQTLKIVLTHLAIAIAVYSQFRTLGHEIQDIGVGTASP